MISRALAQALAVAVSLLPARSVYSDNTASLTPVYVPGDGKFVTTTIDSQTVWQSTNGNFYLYFDVPASFTFTTGMPVYVQVVYYDTGYGTLQLQYDSTYSAQLA